MQADEMPERHRSMTDEFRRKLFAEPVESDNPFRAMNADELARLPNILRLGCGHESSIGTRLMRTAADEIEKVRAELAAALRRVEELERDLRLVLHPIREVQPGEPGHRQIPVSIRVEDVRQARATLALRSVGLVLPGEGESAAPEPEPTP
jgi:hypothetical protein